MLNKLFLTLPGLHLIPNPTWMAQSRRSSRRAGRFLSLPAASGTQRSRLCGQGTRLGQCSFGTTARDNILARAGRCWAGTPPALRCCHRRRHTRRATETPRARESADPLTTYSSHSPWAPGVLQECRNSILFALSGITNHIPWLTFKIY